MESRMATEEEREEEKKVCFCMSEEFYEVFREFADELNTTVENFVGIMVLAALKMFQVKGCKKRFMSTIRYLNSEREKEEARAR